MDGFLSRLSIKARLWLLFGAAATVLALIAGIAIVNMEAAKRSTMESLALADRLTDAVNTARTTQVQFRKQVKEWKDLLLRGTEPGMYDKYWSGFTTAEENVSKGVAAMRVQFPTIGIDASKVDPAAAATSELGKRARAALPLFDKTKPETGLLVDTKVRGIDHVAADAIDALVKDIEESKVVMTREIAERVERDQTRAIWLSLASAIGLASVLGVFSVLTIRSITRPLEHTMSVFDSIRGGNLSTAVPADRRHEFGALWHSLDAMQATLRRNTEELKRLHEKSEQLLLNILPAPIADRLKESQQTIAEAYSEATVLFADLVGFTVFSQTVSATDLVQILNKIFSRFDKLCGELGIEKIKTIGDCYMACAGLPVPRADHARAIAELALRMHGEMAAVSAECGRTLQMRIGINTGQVVAGVIGTRKFIYDLWGDAVNTASRMESHGAPGGVHVSDSTYQKLKDDYELLDRGVVHVKGKGDMHTYFLVGRKNEPQAALQEAAAKASLAGAH